MSNLSIILLILLGIISLIDWKFKAIPSSFLTGLILVTIITNFYIINDGLIVISFGLMTFIYSWLLYESDFIGGIADVKVMIIIGLMINSIQIFFIFMLLILLFGIMYKLTFRYILKKDKLEEIPFIPSIYAVYIVLFLIGGFA